MKNRSFLNLILLFIAGAMFVSLVAQEEVLNVARPGQHEYADPMRARDAYGLAGETVNESRLYDFYSRQADYYMAADSVPELLPAYPGLDAGLHGHWGLHNQNNNSDGRRNDMDVGPVQAEVFFLSEDGAKKQDQVSMHKSVVVQLGGGKLGTVFDPETLSYRATWSGGGLTFPPKRWATSSGGNIPGPKQFTLPDSPGWAVDGQWGLPWKDDGFRYRGYHRYGDRIVFNLEIGDARILDMPDAVGSGESAILARSLAFPEGTGSLQARTLQLPENAQAVESEFGYAVYAEGDRRWLTAALEPKSRALLPVERMNDHGLGIRLENLQKGARIRVFSWSGDVSDLDAAIEAIRSDRDLTDPSKLLGGGPASWPLEIAMPGERATDDRSLPYVIDTLPVPFENPYNSMMMFTGIDFFPNGDAAVVTLMGEVWRVSGIDETLERVSWRRIATGLSQPFGLEIVDGVIRVVGRDQVSALHDRNGDGEIDFYECITNDYEGKLASHTHTFGLGTDGQGNDYFINDVELRKRPFGTDRTHVVATGFRNCMGLGVNPDGVVLVGPQEGTWTPASAIIEPREGEFFGFYRNSSMKHHISPAMCYIPRAVENSTGGMVWVDSDRFGPLKDRFLGLSYGYGAWYLILRQDNGPRSQGAIVPLEGEFRSGVVRGAFRPQDGQLYVVGTEGWGNYAVDDGNLNRVRYTGRPFRNPNGFEVFYNGIRVDFPEALDVAAASNVENYLVQQWNYEYAKRYGSPEMSVAHPEKLGHDRVDVRSVQVLNDGRSLFFEIPDLKPVMQMYLRMHLKSDEGTAFEADLYPTVIHLGEAYVFDGMEHLEEGKEKLLSLRVRQEDLHGDGKPEAIDDGAKRPVDRRFTVNALGGLKYDTEELRAKRGEYIALTLTNSDAMPHNLVVVQPGAYETVGMAAFKMLNDPQAGDKHYVPNMPEVLAHTSVIFPGSRHTIYVQLPDEPGEYPYLCTFPGHWQTMKGVLIVE